MREDQSKICSLKRTRVCPSLVKAALTLLQDESPLMSQAAANGILTLSDLMLNQLTGERKKKRDLIFLDHLRFVIILNQLPALPVQSKKLHISIIIQYLSEIQSKFKYLKTKRDTKERMHSQRKESYQYRNRQSMNFLIQHKHMTQPKCILPRVSSFRIQTTLPHLRKTCIRPERYT